MRTPYRIALVLLAATGLLAGVVGVRTVTHQPPTARTMAEAVELAPATPVDTGRAARNLAAAIQIRTVSHQDPAENDTAEWDRLHAWLQATYPAAHAAMTRETIAGHTLIYTWPGHDQTLPPILLMAHQDVVPVTPGTEGDWTHPPFDGVIDDAAIWGRGAVDDKGSLVALFEALEALASSGFAPRRTVHVVSGHDEEAGGSGARAAAQLLEQRGVRPEYVLDEGMLIVDDFPLLGRPVALIGVGEKGYATLKVTAPATGGHSSAPPPETGVEVLAKAVLAITGKPFPLEFDGPAADMVRALAPDASPLVRMAVANEWLFRPLLVRQLAATPAGAATLHTTIAPTMLARQPQGKRAAAGCDGLDQLPSSRRAPTAADVMQRATEAAPRARREAGVGRAPLTIPPPASSSSSSSYGVLAVLSRRCDEGLQSAPALVTATTDSRYMTGLADDVCRRRRPFRSDARRTRRWSTARTSAMTLDDLSPHRGILRPT